ncbi:NADPH-dependent FMN reductase [Sanguibacter suaedae]|uniref:NAD(P)H-dependent oxidoreductase n=1 Tax=Sanguibacter suaedae TaxID=2795737 RepID=A0A934IAM7_9MICO|nr:NADPH-dependent FMN reductase [Sanguibacter suaedae]MBI9114428.1 NAD(P)H-dependent oxidoreductase [Sanguibacter suaedae]
MTTTTEHQTSYRIGYIVGSPAAASINRRLAGALVRLAPAELQLEEIPISDLPFYSYEHDDDYPQVARDLKQAIADVDAVIVLTPEYNRSVPGFLKNALDWASRPYGENSFADKATAIIGASPGAIGTALAQQHLRSILAYCGARQLTTPEAYIQMTPGLVEDDGTVTVESTEEFLRTWLDALADHVRRSLAPTPQA